MTDYTDWGDPQAHATAISTTGAPLLALAGALFSNNNITPAPGSPFDSGFLPVNQISYEVYIACHFAVGTVNPFVQVQLQWFDPGEASQMFSDSFIIPGATSTPGMIIRGRGPVKGAVLVVQVTNLDATNTPTIIMQTITHSRPYATDRWAFWNKPDAALTVPGYVLPGLPDDEAILGMLDGVTIAASSQNVYLFSMHPGLINFGYEVNTGISSNLSIRVRPAPDSTYSGHNIIYSATNPPSNFQIAGNRAPLRVIVANAATTPMVMSLSAIRAD